MSYDVLVVNDSHTSCMTVKHAPAMTGPPTGEIVGSQGQGLGFETSPWRPTSLFVRAEFVADGGHRRAVTFAWEPKS